MRITLTGGTGFIGKRLSQLLESQGHELRFLTRDPGGRPGFFAWDPMTGEPPEAALEGADAVFHLAGEPVAQRWTAAARQRIRDSRVVGTRHLVQALTTLKRRPGVLVAASAIGYYGSRGDEILPETAPPGTGFLPDTCVEWEQASELAGSLGIRVVHVRTGIALGAEGGALKQMLPPFRAGLGGRLGNGEQWMSWIHANDLVQMMVWAATTPSVRGAINGVSPHPITNKVFTDTLSQALHRPAFLPVPEFALYLLFGKMAEVLLGSQRVVPAAARTLGFRFQHPELGGAMTDLLGRP